MFSLLTSSVRSRVLLARRLYSTSEPPRTPQPRQLSAGEQVIHDKLSDRFTPTELRVQDISGGCGSFYAVSITSEAFKGLSIVKQHKLVTETLKKEIKDIHGLQIKTIPA